MQTAYKILGRVVLLTLLGVMGCRGQGYNADPVYSATNVINCSSTCNSNPVPNVGQNTHQFFYLLTNNGANSCLSAAGIPIIYASQDNVNYITLQDIAQTRQLNINGSTAYSTIIATTSGSFPYVKTSFQAFDNVNCTVTIFYAGTKSYLSLIRPYLGYPVAGTTNSPMLRRYDNQLSASGDNTVQNCTALSGTNVFIYSLIISAVGGANVVTFKSGSGTLMKLSLAANQILTFPYTGNAWFTTASSNNLIYNLGTATEVDFSTQSRCE